VQFLRQVLAWATRSLDGLDPPSDKWLYYMRLVSYASTLIVSLRVPKPATEKKESKKRLRDGSNDPAGHPGKQPFKCKECTAKVQ
jgi:hypothetical protein